MASKAKTPKRAGRVAQVIRRSRATLFEWDFHTITDRRGTSSCEPRHNAQERRCIVADPNLRLANQSCEIRRAGRAGRIGSLERDSPGESWQRATNLHYLVCLGDQSRTAQLGDRKTQWTREDHWGSMGGQMRNRVRREG